MKKIEFKLRKSLRKIFNGISLTAVAFIFQSCYGPEPDWRYCDVKLTGTVTSKTTNLPVKGIKIAVENGLNFGFTDEEGKFDFYVSVPDGFYCASCTSNQAKIHFRDIDDAENGHFSDKTVEINLRCNGEFNIDVELEENELSE